MNNSPKYIYVIIYFFVSFTIDITNSSSQSNSGSIIGIVTDDKNNGLFNVNIVISDTTLGTASEINGNYRIDDLRPGIYSLKFMSIGYKTEIRKDIVIHEGQSTQLNVKLEQIVLPMEEIVVTPGILSVSKSQTAKRQVIQKERITSLPATLDDIYRVIQIMPGVSFSDDFSAHFHVRGGKQNENLILLDGMEIFDPYHLKNIGGAVGVMNMDLIEDVKILTGGFPAKYGDKLSSVVAVENREGQQQKLCGSIGAGGTGAKIVLEGPIPRGSWLFSYRKSFLKEAVDFLNPTEYSFSPSFYDTQGKVAAKLNSSNHFVANILYSKDNSYLEKWRSDSDLFSNYGNGYYGIVWKSFISPVLFSELIISRGENFWDNRIGKDKKEKLNLTENVVNWNLNFQPNRNHDLNFGITYKHIHYKYELKTDSLSQHQQDLEELVESYFGDANISPTTFKISTYLQNKFRIFKPLLANVGIRYDYFEYNQNQQWSPRVGLAYTISHKTILRAAWGHYYQAPTYTELTNTKGADTNPGAEKAIHYVLGAEYYFSDHFNIRLEGYYKKLTQMIGHYFETLEPPNHPIIRYGNPYNGYAKGIELFMNGKILPQLSLWFTYAYSKTKIEASYVNWEERIVEEKLIPRFTDQPHNLTFFVSYNLPKNWKLNIKWRYLSGIPYTPMYPVWDSSNKANWQRGEVYSSRYPPYHRLDFRIGKRFNFKYFNFLMFFEIKNIYNRNNVLLYNYKIENGKHHRKVYYTLPFLPSLEFNISF